MSAPRRCWLALALAGVGACGPNKAAFYDTVYVCSSSLPCGTAQDGKPMVCYPGNQLGGDPDSAFCAEACDPDGGTPPSGHICSTAGALLQTCVPDPASGASDGCPAGLNCYRTDLIEDQGVCLRIPVCTTNSDCTDSSHPTCAVTLIEELYPTIQTDHLQCVQDNCSSNGASCRNGESCAAAYYDLGTGEPAICVPNCIGDNECPPNSFCAENPDAMGSARICVPGLPGGRCNNEQDCVIGDCKDTGAGFDECVFLSCTSDADCTLQDTQEVAVCANSQCEGLGPFHGTSCMSSTDCPMGQECSSYSPYGVTMGRGECRIPCDADGTCPIRAGVPEVCLDYVDKNSNPVVGGCYPGEFGMPCTQSSQCLSELGCLAAAPDPRTVITNPTICSIACTTDADCRSSPFIRTDGFCDGSVCRLSGDPNAPCTRDEQCGSDQCVTDPTSLVQQCQ